MFKIKEGAGGSEKGHPVNVCLKQEIHTLGRNVSSRLQRAILSGKERKVAKLGALMLSLFPLFLLLQGWGS